MKAITGNVATLELLPRQAESVANAKQLGELELALRSIADGLNSSDRGQDLEPQQRGGAVTIVRYGVSVNVPTAGK